MYSTILNIMFFSTGEYRHRTLAQEEDNDFGKIISILKQYNCKKVLLAGKVKKPNFSRLKLDFKGVYYIPRIIKKAIDITYN